MVTRERTTTGGLIPASQCLSAGTAAKAVNGPVLAVWYQRNTLPSQHVTLERAGRWTMVHNPLSKPNTATRTDLAVQGSCTGRSDAVVQEPA